MHPRSLASLVTPLVCAIIACSEGGGGSRAVAQPEPGATAAAAAAPSGPCRLTVGWEPFEPYQYRGADGTLAGVDVDLVRAVAARVHCEVAFAEGRSATLLRRLQRGDVNVLAGAMRTPARESFALFSDPYRNASFALYVRKGDATVQRSTSLQALLDTGFRLGVREQFVYGETVDGLQENPIYSDRFVGATLSGQNYQRLLDLEIDGFLEDPVSARLAIRAQGMQEEVEAHPLPIYSGDVALMFGKAGVDPALVGAVNAALAEMKSSGEVQDIVDKYTN
jgi:polar amino acid transport system substrate-binding protein